MCVQRVVIVTSAWVGKLNQTHEATCPLSQPSPPLYPTLIQHQKHQHRRHARFAHQAWKEAQTAIERQEEQTGRDRSQHRRGECRLIEFASATSASHHGGRSRWSREQDPHGRTTSPFKGQVSAARVCICWGKGGRRRQKESEQGVFVPRPGNGAGSSLSIEPFDPAARRGAQKCVSAFISNAISNHSFRKHRHCYSRSCTRKHSSQREH